jgi:hypothetical protein
MDVHVLRTVRQIVVSPTLRNASILVFFVFGSGPRGAVDIRSYSYFHQLIC